MIEPTKGRSGSRESFAMTPSHFGRYDEGKNESLGDWYYLRHSETTLQRIVETKYVSSGYKITVIYVHKPKAPGKMGWLNF